MSPAPESTSPVVEKKVKKLLFSHMKSLYLQAIKTGQTADLMMPIREGILSMADELCSDEERDNRTITSLMVEYMEDLCEGRHSTCLQSMARSITTYR